MTPRDWSIISAALAEYVSLMGQRCAGAEATGRHEAAETFREIGERAQGVRDKVLARLSAEPTVDDWLERIESASTDELRQMAPELAEAPEDIQRAVNPAYMERMGGDE